MQTAFAASTPQALIREFCTHFYSKSVSAEGCSWEDAHHLLYWEQDQSGTGLRDMYAFLEPGAQWMVPTQNLRRSFPEGPGPDYECERVKGVPTAEDFLTKYVAASRPVILEDVAASWPAVSERRWNMSYLTEQAGSTIVKGYVSPDGDFEKVREGTHHAIRSNLEEENLNFLFNFTLFNLSSLRREGSAGGRLEPNVGAAGR